MSEKKDVLEVKNDIKTIATESSVEQTETCSCTCECGCECEDEGCCECEGDIEYGSCACAAADHKCAPLDEEVNPISPEELKLKKDQEELVRLNELFDKAMDICIQVHSGQLDLAGFDYTEHPIRVSSKALKYNFEYILSKPMRLKVIIASLLHDVIEDIADAVVSVSRNKGEDYMDYVYRAAENPIGRWVKYFDLQDNLDISRFARNLNYEFTDKDLRRLNKYAKAYRHLATILGTAEIIGVENPL